MTNLIATQITLMAQMFLVDFGALVQDAYDSFQEWLWDFIGIDKIIDNSIGGEALESINKILFMGSNSDGIYSYYWSAINLILDVVEPIGFALITTFFIVYIFDLASKDQMTFDMLVKMAIQLIVVVAVAGNLNTIINSFLSISDSMLNGIIGQVGGLTLSTPTGSNGMTFGEEVVSDWVNNSYENLVSALFKATLLWLVHQISVIATYFAAFSRAFDIGWRISFAPIGIANSFEGGSNSAGIKYLKALLGSILSGVLVYVVILLSFKVSAGLLVADGFKANTFASAACLLAGAGAAVGMSAKSKELIG